MLGEDFARVFVEIHGNYHLICGEQTNENYG